jgi:signal transduction histidine kinase
MIRNWFNGRTVFSVIAIIIVIGTVIYSNYLSKKLAAEERIKVENWVEAQRTILKSSDSSTLNLAVKISSDNHHIPIIETNEQDSITGNYINLDSNSVLSEKNYLQQKLKEFKNQNKPIVTVISTTPYIANKYYYGESVLLKEIRYYPIVQLIIVALFIVILIITQRTHFKSSQNQLWAGMAKETAHQLGTPVTSLQGWVEVLKDTNGAEKIVPELEKDVQRLLLITDRFGKIGSTPQLENKNIIELVQVMMDYIKKRAGTHVDFNLNASQIIVIAKVSPPLFDWVIENLLKNALDAMEGKGKITVAIFEEESQIIIDISDTGKGIAKNNFQNIFKPGFTTKKRGWGLGLTLTKRIVEEYHKGQIFIVESELNKGTTFRIILKK